jgi:purine nucleosidase
MINREGEGIMMINILLFVDSGIDDSLALMYAVQNPELNIVGVVSGYGNITKEESLRNTAYLLKKGGREDIPIIAGVSGPLSGKPATFYPEIHGEEGLGPIQPPEDFTGLKVYDINKIIDIIDQYKNDIVLVGLGRQTDLALPLIIYGEDAYKDVNAIYMMGGAFLVPGNVSAEAEANFYSDPLAADIVLEKGRNVYLFPLNVTNKAVVTPEMIDYISANTESAYKDLIKPAFEYYFQAYKKNVPGIGGAPIHDAVPLIVLTNPDLAKFIKRRVRVEQFGGAQGKTNADFRPKPEEQPEDTLDYIAMEIDTAKLLETFMLNFTAV